MNSQPGRVRLEGVSSGSNGCATEGLLYDLSNLRRAATTCLLMLFVLPICGLEPAGFARCSNRCQSTNNSAIPRGLEKSVRSVLYAIYSNDAETLRKWIVPESDSDDLLGLAHLTAQHLKELRQEVGAMQLSQVSPFTVDGREVTLGSKPAYPLGARTIFVTQLRGNALTIPVVYTGGGWKVDVRFWIAAKKQAAAAEQLPNPEMIAIG